MSDAKSAEYEEEETMKKLCKSNTDRKICGVCGGIAEYFNIDANLVRLVAIIAAVMGGTGVLAYIAAALIIPEAERAAE